MNVFLDPNSGKKGASYIQDFTVSKIASCQSSAVTGIFHILKITQLAFSEIFFPTKKFPFYVFAYDEDLFFTYLEAVAKPVIIAGIMLK